MTGAAAAKAPAGARVACREIEEGDAAAVVALLCRGFGAQDGHWPSALAALGARRVPPSCPRYGYCLTADGAVVGVLLLIFSDHGGGGATGTGDAGADGRLRCTVSSWFVDPDYRFYASTLLKTAYRRTRCTYLNTSSEAHTRPGLLAQGYRCFAEGQVLAVPALGRRRAGVAVRRVRGRDDAGDGPHGRLLADHAESGCISLAVAAAGREHAFVFLRRRLPRLGLPVAQLVFCEDVADFVALHAALGRYLLRLGLPLVMVDAVGPVAGLPGRYLAGRMPKYAYGPTMPRLGDLAYGEDALFGLGRKA